jgi:hypothetical protein
MSVYYVLSPDLGLVKVGFAKDPTIRFSKIQSDSPTRLILAAVEDGGEEVEALRHTQFAHLRARAEWFHNQGELAEHIATLPPYVRTKKRKLTGPLGAWIIRNNHTLTTVAELTGTTQATLSRICMGRHIPRRELMVRIWEETGGEIDANTMFELHCSTKAKAA